MWIGFNSGQEPLAETGEYGDESSGSIKGGELFDCLSDC
jgi:hypothetical protein